MAIIVETERLRLRSWERGDADAFYRHCNTPAVTRHLGGLRDRDHYRVAVDRMRAVQAERGHCFWVVERRADAAFLGFCGLKIATTAEPSANGLPEIGWRLREDAWGQGYAREAATATLDQGFCRLGMSAIVAFTIPANRPSWGLMERLGMTRFPDFEEPSLGAELNPTVYYRIAARDWRCASVF